MWWMEEEIFWVWMGSEHTLSKHREMSIGGINIYIEYNDSKND
jgi:hypothetical protein